MLKLNRNELNDKIYACWIGKNIGGTLGGPYEGKKMVLDCKGFTTEPGVPLPNDDLDLQLIWLKAMREVGPRHLDCSTLGTYWLEYITPCWNEYGVAKSNMKNGLMPPLSGQFENKWKHSNGAWFFHMVSDMAGSSTSVGKGSAGTGLPGPIVSFLKEISALPIFRNMNKDGYKEFSVWISKLFNGTLLGKRDESGKLIENPATDDKTM